MAKSSWKPRFSVGLYTFSHSDGKRIGSVNKLERAFAKIRSISGIEGVEFFYPEDVSEKDGEKVRELCKRLKLSPVNVFASTYEMNEWGKGSIGSPERKVRRKAIEKYKGAVDAAKTIGSPMVTLWVPTEGYNYPFQLDYNAAWDRIMASVLEVADYEPSIRIAMEYRPFYPHSRSLFGSAGKALALVANLRIPRVGILLEISHTLMALEGLGETIAFASRMKKLFHVHLNDAYSSFDTALPFGTVTFWDCMEALFWLRETQYEGYLGLDVREEWVRQSMNNALSMMKVVDNLNMKRVRESLSIGEGESVQRYLWKSLNTSRGSS